MNHDLTLADALNRFVVLEDNTGERACGFDAGGTELGVYWTDQDGTHVRYCDGTQFVPTDGNYFYATDRTGQAFRFRAYTIVNFDEALPGQC